MFAISFMYICLLYWVFVFGLRYFSRAWCSGYKIRPVMGRYQVGISTHCWAFSESFIPSFLVWSWQNKAFGGEKQSKKNSSEQSDVCDITFQRFFDVFGTFGRFFQINSFSATYSSIKNQISLLF